MFGINEAKWLVGTNVARAMIAGPNYLTLDSTELLNSQSCSLPPTMITLLTVVRRTSADRMLKRELPSYLPDNERVCHRGLPYFALAPFRHPQIRRSTLRRIPSRSDSGRGFADVRRVGCRTRTYTCLAIP